MARGNAQAQSSELSSTTSTISSEESIETTIPPMTSKEQRRESWKSLNSDLKMKKMFRTMDKIQNKDDLSKWLYADLNTGYFVIKALHNFHIDNVEQIEQLKADLQVPGKETQKAGQEIDQLKESNNQLRESRSHLQQIVREQSDRIAALEEQSTTQASSSTDSSTTEKLPDISIWTGGTPKAFQSWLTNLRMKLSIDENHFPTNRYKVAYLINRLGDEARDFMEVFLDKGADSSYDELLHQLKRRYADPQRKATARNEYTTLKQMSKDLPSFIGEFYKLAAAAEVPEDWQINDLQNKLNDRFYNRIIGQSFDSLPDMIHFLVKLDFDLKRRDQNKATRPAARRPPPKCYACQEIGHIAKNCLKGKATPSLKL